MVRSIFVDVINRLVKRVDNNEYALARLLEAASEPLERTIVINGDVIDPEILEEASRRREEVGWQDRP